jgi:hypothetical protein
VGAQNAQNWTASIMIGLEPKSARNGGYSLVIAAVAWYRM